ncbi:hypothetical protein H0H93_011151, partial [Arthromyces matolae]
MRILPATGILALILADLLYVAATPVPFRSSELVPKESLDAKIPSTDNVNVSFAVFGRNSEQGHDIVARFNSNEDDEPHASDPTTAAQSTSDRIAIPSEFLPLRSPPIKLIVPTRPNLSGWGSVINIFHLMDAAADLDTNGRLHESRDAFKEQLETIMAKGRVKRKSLHVLRQELEVIRPTALVLANTTNVALEGLQDSIKKATELHNTFEGEIMVPQGFIGGAQKLAIKVPYGNGRKEAIASLNNIVTLMYLAEGHDQTRKVQMRRLKQSLTHVRFNLALPSSRIHKPILDGDQLCVIQLYIQKVVKQHNAGHWMEEDDIKKWKQGTSEDTSCDVKISKAKTSIQIPSCFLPEETPRLSMPVPPSNDAGGIERVDGILMLMAKLDWMGTLKT